jgi:hypothetical protein
LIEGCDHLEFEVGVAFCVLKLCVLRCGSNVFFVIVLLCFFRRVLFRVLDVFYCCRAHFNPETQEWEDVHFVPGGASWVTRYGPLFSDFRSMRLAKFVSVSQCYPKKGGVFSYVLSPLMRTEEDQNKAIYSDAA